MRWGGFTLDKISTSGVLVWITLKNYHIPPFSVTFDLQDQNIFDRKYSQSFIFSENGNEWSLSSLISESAADALFSQIDIWHDNGTEFYQGYNNAVKAKSLVMFSFDDIHFNLPRRERERERERQESSIFILFYVIFSYNKVGM